MSLEIPMAVAEVTRHQIARALVKEVSSPLAA